MRRTLSGIVALAGLAVGGVASASVVVTFDYNDLDGDYTATSATSGTFQAFAADLPAFRSSGTVSRVIPTTGDAVFEPGFWPGTTQADALFEISVNKALPTSTTATGSGVFFLLDANGDQITGNISGNWTDTGTFIVFDGALSNVTFVNFSGDLTFNGSDPSSTNWSFADLIGTIYSGAVVTLSFDPAGFGSFFSTSFSNVATGVDGQIIPAPGALALLGLGGLVAARRRR